MGRLNEGPPEGYVPDWRAIRFDETQYCSPEFVELCGGKVYTVYIYNHNEATYLCEMQPSYCLIPVDLVAEVYPEDDEERERLDEVLREVHLNDEVTYIHCSDIKDSETIPLGDFESEDEAREYYQGNPRF
jgi:hypothetical protein